ncbi:MAG: S8 family peptidase, partial [candidate division Zixibacteria bacterium]|nr:S8 family peptidase [candidate division Zixibacteria bacterium]
AAVIDNRGYGDGFTLARAIEQAVDDGCNVINISLVLMAEHLAVRDAINYAESQGVAVVAAAGNESNAGNLYPAAFANVISVAAIDSTMLLADFSSYGANVDICAPGTMIYSTYKDGLFAWWSGSSFAAPFVAGQVAMLREISPSASNPLLEYAITATGTDIDDINPDVSGLLGGGLADPPASLSSINNLAMADLMPDTAYVDLYEGRVYVTNPMLSSFLTSTNAPAGYTAEVVDDGDVFTMLMAPTGTTNDTVWVSVDPYLPVLGTHYDEVLFTVDGVPEPVSLTVCATMHEADTSATAWLSHPTLYFQAQVGTDETQSVPSILYSSNAPAGFVAEVLPGGGGFTSLPYNSGLTDDSVMVTVNPGGLTLSGNYLDSVRCSVAGVPDPVYISVWLNMYDSTVDGDSAWVYTDSATVFVMGEGSLDVRTGWVDVMSSNAPANFTVTFAEPPDFITLVENSGQTNGYFSFEVNPGTLIMGNYQDVMQVWVEGCANSPINVPVTLLVVPPGSEDPDSAWVSPIWHGFESYIGSDTVHYGAFEITSRIVPSAFTVSHVDPADFISITNPTGFTPDTVHFTVTSTAQTAPGVYYDTLSIEVEGAYNSPLRVFAFHRVVEAPTGESLILTPDTIDFTIAPGTDPVTVTSFLSSTASPMNYIGWLDTVSTIWMNLNNTSGTTDEEVSVTVYPAGFTAGTYAGTAFFSSPDADNTVRLLIRMTVDTSSGPPPSEMAWTIPNHVYVAADEGSTTPIEATVNLNSSNAPAWYSGWSMNASGLHFVTLPDSAGQTPSPVSIMIDPSGLTAGAYGDTVIFDVAGVVDPAVVVVELTITAPTKAPTGVQNFPNPFNPLTQISFTLGAPSRVNLTVYNIAGQVVTTLVDQHLEAGEHGFQFDGSRVSSGVYFYRLQTETAIETRKMILLK